MKDYINGTNFELRKEDSKKYLILRDFSPSNFPIDLFVSENQNDIDITSSLKHNVSLYQINYNQQNIKLDNNNYQKALKALESAIYSYLKDLFEKFVDDFLYQHSLNNKSLHADFDPTPGSNYNKKLEIKDLVDDFIRTPNEIKFRAFWNVGYIFATTQQANATTIIKKYNNDLIQLKKNIEEIIKINPNGTNFKNIEKQITQFPGLTNSALELYFSYHIIDDNFPNYNSTDKDGLKFVEKFLGNDFFKSCKDDKEKMDKIISSFNLNNFNGIPKYYVLDQIFNILIKTKHGQENDKTYVNHKTLYETVLKIIDMITPFYVEEIKEFLKTSNNIIFYGAPGTGKTYLVKETLKQICPDEEYYEFVQFHPSYTYEDFIEGIKPYIDKDGSMKFKPKNGIFKDFCEKAKDKEEAYKNAKDKSDKYLYAYFFVIDEINRAELSRVFGELLYCIEYRGEKIKTQYSSNYPDDKEKYFYVPKNVYIIGTMNDIDRSIDSFDIALRRRFNWIRRDFEKDVLLREISQFNNCANYVNVCLDLNNFLTSADNGPQMGSIYTIGHAYFLKISDFIDNKSNKIEQKHLNQLFKQKLEPLIREYLRSKYDEANIEKHINACSAKFKI